MCTCLDEFPDFSLLVDLLEHESSIYYHLQRGWTALLDYVDLHTIQ